MNKEREAFELWCVKDDEFCIHRYDGSDEYSDDYTQCAWLAWQAKAQAVPKGFVLVPKEPTEAMYIAGIDKRQSGGNTADVYKAMIKAQEPK